MQQQVLPLSLRATAFLLSSLSKPLPGITARLFYRLYCTPPSRKLRPVQLEMRKTARVEQVSLTGYPFDNTPLRITTYRWGSAPRKVLLLHGWGGSPFDFRHMVTALHDSGYEVLTYDAPAHGDSSGKRTNLIQWMHVLQQLISREGPVHAVIGHSLGALNAALTMARKDTQVPRLVMMSSALNAPAFFQEAFDLFRIDAGVMPVLQRLIRDRLHEDLEEMNLFRYISRIKSDRILIAYDTNDQIAKAGEIDAFVQAYPGIHPLKISGEGHFRIMRDEAVIKGVLEFLQ